MTAPRNMSASVQARLRNLAMAQGDPVASLHIRYVLERLLYRLSVSPYGDRFVLKGAMLFALWVDMPHRPTQDLDLLAYDAPEMQRIEMIFRELCDAVAPDDGLRFDPATVRAEQVREEQEYGCGREVPSDGGARYDEQPDEGLLRCVGAGAVVRVRGTVAR